MLRGNMEQHYRSDSRSWRASPRRPSDQLISAWALLLLPCVRRKPALPTTMAARAAALGITLVLGCVSAEVHVDTAKMWRELDAHCSAGARVSPSSTSIHTIAR